MTKKEAQDRFIKATAKVMSNPPGLINRILPGGKKREKEYFDTVKKSVEKIKSFKKEHYNWRDSLTESEDIQEIGLPVVVAKTLGALKGATMTKGGLMALGGGIGLGSALPAIIAPKTMITLAGLGAAAQGAGVIKQTVRKQAADKENQNLRMRMGMGEEKDTRTSFVDKSGFYKKGAEIVQTPSDKKGNLPSNPRLGFSKETLNKKGKLKEFNPTNEHYDWRDTLDEKCWAGYEKKGMKTMFGKRYPNCVKKSKKKK